MQPKYKRMVKVFIFHICFIAMFLAKSLLDDHHFFYIFFVDDSQFGYIKKFLKRIKCFA